MAPRMSLTSLVIEHERLCDERVAQMGLECHCDPNRMPRNDHRDGCPVGSLRRMLWDGMLMDLWDDEISGINDVLLGSAPTRMIAADVGLEGPTWFVARPAAKVGDVVTMREANALVDAGYVVVGNCYDWNAWTVTAAPGLEAGR